MNKQMRAVVSIVDYSRGGEMAEIFKSEKVPVRFVTHGHGAADSEMLNYLGFGENKKSVMMSLLTPERANRIFYLSEQKMHLNKPGSGIIFSVPISSMTAFLAALTNKDSENNIKLEKECEQKVSHELIVTIITKGFFPEVKAAANSAGARGGTLIHALGLGGEEAQKFLGISIQPEKDVILIIVKREEKSKVMKAIADAAGINTQGRGIIFSVPVDSALGLSED